ncbi:hypothetical protein [Mesorhizobium huakuii]|uniref:Uncharacterized protein n=1 Tax=Mesorhizobium huakuii TaxID=28104 RepID=A0A7G6SMG7_9HYPH|nr:hypothetical protein [Mesorhizobium huakuii]QND55699.1 hypothetical protein HB778_02725 [Mesorhizobium huakuii]
MSDNFLRLVPYDPHWHPDAPAAAAAMKIASGLFPLAEHVAVEYEEGVTFFDAGANTESVHCPFCGSDLEDWWGEAMDRARRHASKTFRSPRRAATRPRR